MKATPGTPTPLGATIDGNGVQFALFSRHAMSVTLAIFDAPDQAEPSAVFDLDPAGHRTGDIWHARVDGIGAGALYLFRVDGPSEPQNGHRFNPDNYLLDPYARAVVPGEALADPNATSVPKCAVIANEFDWQGDLPLNYPLRESVIYETHVRGLSIHPSSGVKHPGTYRGVVEMIPYLQSLGVTSLELLPIHEFDESELHRRNPLTGEPLRNYWGYSTAAFFAPKASYAADSAPGAQVAEFKLMVRELHKAGFELILDVVFNHTAEGSDSGPTISFRGIDNSIYYILDDDKRLYRDFTGTGNTLNCNHPVVQSLILDCLHYWVVEMHVDGFRFDLGSILARDSDGNLLENPPLLERIAQDPILRDTKLIAEAWDAGGAYQVGSFPGGRWAEWNDQYRDDVRRFWRGDRGYTASLATRLAGSSDLYLGDGRKPFHSINFTTCHDGFTLADLLSHSQKHNEANGEDNRDGMDENYSANNGVEGDTEEAKTNRIRVRQSKNILTTLMLSLGTPMLLGGDEFGRTQKGNNNAYCQDNEISWYDHRLLHSNAEILEFAQKLIRFRLSHPAFLRPEFFTGRDTDFNLVPDITWYNEHGQHVDWSKIGRTLALRIDGSHSEIQADRDDNDFFLIFSSSPRSVLVAMCEPPEGKQWHRVIDTARTAPDEFLSNDEADPYAESHYRCAARSVVVFLSR